MIISPIRTPSDKLLQRLDPLAVLPDALKLALPADNLVPFVLRQLDVVPVRVAAARTGLVILDEEEQSQPILAQLAIVESDGAEQRLGRAVSQVSESQLSARGSVVVFAVGVAVVLGDFVAEAADGLVDSGASLVVRGGLAGF
jgi:hypothetical protein